MAPTDSRMDERTELIVDTLTDAFAPLMRADPVAFRGKYRRMASDPHAFFRGSACLYYADVTAEEDPFCDERSGRIWIHGDLHVENFGTYLSADGRLVFDVNDFDEAYVGRFTWDLQRFAASLALVGWQKALPETDVRRLIETYVAAYLDQVDAYVESDDDQGFALHLDNTDGPIHDVLVAARQRRRADLLDGMTIREEGVRRFREDPTVRRLEATEQARVVTAYEDYVESIPQRQAARARALLRAPGRGREVRLRDRQRRPAGVQHPDRGVQRGARQRRRAVDEAGQRAGGEPVRRP